MSVTLYRRELDFNPSTDRYTSLENIYPFYRHAFDSMRLRSAITECDGQQLSYLLPGVVVSYERSEYLDSG
jgi:hypothetical protein